MNLLELKDATKENFEDWLNTKTQKLKSEFPGDAKGNWGAARKALNVFLEDAFYNRFLAAEFGLDRLEGFLEVPLDSYVVRGIKGDLDKANIRCDLPQWSRFKDLTPSKSNRFQNCAANVAATKGISRVYLDLLYWGRPERRGRE